MSKETEHLKLFKYDKETDDFDTTTFNVQQALNNNWDKIDLQMANMATKQNENTNKIEENKDALNTKMNKSGGVFTGITQANNNTSYTVKQVRNIILSTEEANSSLMANGDIWIQYDPN
ncbi:hypothetical protein FDF69_20285 [Clostridium sporogenes]|uniref:hypothetical protein n=1 Tax=Clostridium sporogenes TaxID=1509 RepID=UPI0013D235DE|nr:hypothetical protein [Clostridium sporogenes]NFF69441.1 hypothetical protein [Clostridium sporogenes]NFG00711.1 hypothetical protein [Clostridium sporogenes]NFG08281.1 hypothetical protein [Clostridium sporogenes]NFG53412.1 hypothetical protein [Clostridium sporogenes]NFP86240.1 hypothetical protein [Clostridium sporogenes]